MRELTYFVAVSLDGFIAAPDHTFDAFPVTGDHMDMIFQDYPETLPAPARAALGITAAGSHFDTVLMGWNTYAVGLPMVPSPYPHLRQVVFSRAQRTAPAEVDVTADDPVAVVRRLKAQEGSGIWLCGGGQLAAALAGEIDRLVLKVNPVLLGDGIPLFAASDHHQRDLDLVASTAFSSGVVVGEYVRS